MRASGTDGGIPLIDSILSTKHLGLEVVVDYVLESGASHLEIVTTVKNTTDKELVVPGGDLVLFGDSLRVFSHRCGQNLEATLGTDGIEWFAAGGEGVSYGLTAVPPTKMTVPLTREEILPVLYGEPTLEPGEEFSFHRYFIIGNGTIDSIAAYAWALRGFKKPAECRVVLDGFGEWGDRDTMAVEALRTDEEAPELAHISMTTPDEDGVALLRLPPGTYDIRISRPGTQNHTIEDVDVQLAEPTELAHTLAQPGRVHAKVTGPSGLPMNAKLSLQPGHDAGWAAGIQQIILVRDGQVMESVLPGEYTATVSKGFEYDVHRANITISAGETETVEADLERVIDTTGWLSLDTHDHCELSIDSNLLVEDRVYAAAAEGVEVFVLTDHDHFGTIQPLIEELGLAEQLHCIQGNEVSPLYGHQVGAGCLPLEYDSYFTMDWTLQAEDGSFLRLKTPSEVWAEMRDVHGCQLVAVAHPYCSQALFEFHDLDENTDPASLDADTIDVTLLDAVELINSHDEWDEIYTQNLPGWANLLNRGYLLPIIGGADSHGISQTIGHPRNLVLSSTDTPGAVVEEDLLKAVREFRSQVYGGPFIKFTINGKGLGETALPADGQLTAQIDIYAPEWMELGYVRLFANGELLSEFAPSGSEVHRLSETADMEVPDTDTWYVVAAGSETFRMGPVAHNRPPISLTNPVWVDVGGDGFAPPSP